MTISPTHEVRITLNTPTPDPDEKTPPNLAAISLVLTQLHLNQSRAPIAIAFPKMQNRNFGSDILLVGSESNLKTQLENPLLQAIIQDVGVRTAIKARKNTGVATQFRRTRPFDKSKPSYIRNVLKHGAGGAPGGLRHKIRQLAAEGKSVEEIHEILDRNDPKPRGAWINFNSCSTRSTFPLGVAREQVADDRPLTIDAFGLTKTGSILL